MRIDYFFTMANLEKKPYREVLEDALYQTRRCEEYGFETVWMGEHHFGGEGYDIQSNPIMTATYLAGHTSRIRLGMAAVVLPAWHPLRLAEDLAILDHISNGRLDCGVARGITNRELSNLSHLNIDRRFPDANREIFAETVEIIRRAWTEDPFRWSGKYYQFPRPGVSDSYAAWYPRNPDWRDADDQYVGMSIIPKPLQDPHPPLWNVGDTDASFEYAAENGLLPIAWLRSPQALASTFEVYRKAASKKQDRELKLGEQCGLLRVCVVAPTSAQARAIAEPGVERLFRDYIGGLRTRAIYAEPGEVISAADEAKPWFDFLDDRGHLLVGTPDEVSAKIEGLRADVGLEHVLLLNWLPTMPLADVNASLDLIGREVLPNFA